MKKDEKLVDSYANKYVTLTHNGVTKSGYISERFGRDNFYYNEIILTTSRKGKQKEIYLTKYYVGTMTSELRQQTINEYQIREKINPLK